MTLASGSCSGTFFPRSTANPPWHRRGRLQGSPVCHFDPVPVTQSTSATGLNAVGGPFPRCPWGAARQNPHPWEAGAQGPTLQAPEQEVLADCPRAWARPLCRQGHSTHQCPSEGPAPLSSNPGLKAWHLLLRGYWGGVGFWG